MKRFPMWLPACFAVLGFALQGWTQTNLFLMPRLYPRHMQLAQRFKQELQQGDFAAMEQTCREGVTLLPDDPTWRYNLACTLARQSRQREALDELQTAIRLGFRDARTIANDADLALLRRLPRFKALLEEAEKTRDQPVAGRPAQAPARVAEEALVSPANTTWNFDMGIFQTYFKFPDPTPRTGTGWLVRLPGPAGDAIRAWQREGSAAGNAGDLYDNRDEGHSRLKLSLFPEMRPVVYSPEARQARVNSGLTLFAFNGVPVLGNSSTASTAGPFWRSNARMAYADGRSIMLLALQYLRNQHYVFPQHRDYLPSVEGDTFPANTPYLTLSPGSSYTDQPILEAFAAAMAALRPAVKAALIKDGMLFPTLQMLLRVSQKAVVQRTDYLTNRAHPVVFDGARIDLLRLVTLAHDLQTNALPPFAALRTREEPRAVAGRDFFDLAGGEGLFDSPAAIARVVRGMAYTRRMVVDGSASRNPMPSHLKPHWVLLQGDPAKVRITPRLGEPFIAEIEIDYHGGRFPASTNNPILTSRVEIALIVDNGVHYSPPAYVTFYYLNNEIRTYTEGHLILSVDYAGAAGRYTDPLLSMPRRWRDLYAHDARKRLTGWTRIRGTQTESFTADGAHVLTRDARGRPLTARVVNYVRRDGEDAAGKPTFEVVQIDTDRVLTYAYASEDDTVGEVQRESRAPVKE